MKAFKKALLEFLAADADRALSVLTGNFVAVTLEMIRRRCGEEALAQNVEITGGHRIITIHKPEDEGDSPE